MAGKKLTELEEKTTLDGSEQVYVYAEGDKRVSLASVKEFCGQDPYGSSDYCAGWWKEDDLSPQAREVVGDKDLLAWDFYLLDTTDNAGQTTTPVGKLMKNNLLRFEDGRYAPTVGITEAMRAECDVELYLDAAHTQKYCEAGQFDAAAFYDTYGMDQQLYNASGEAVRILRPWETTETKYTIGLGRMDTVYLLDNVVGKSGKRWKGLFGKPVVWDGIDVSAYPLPPTAIAPCPVCTVGGKTRAFFFLYEGETNCKSSSGQAGLCTMFVNGRTYPRVTDMQQATNITFARANNADNTLPYPFAEGGFHALNAYITSQEVLYETKYLHDNNLFGSGISSNDGCNSESTWKQNGGVRYRPSGGAWKYAVWSAQGDIYYNATPTRTSFSITLNSENPKEQCLESQMVASFAMETGVAEDTEFEFYGATYWYRNVTNAKGLQDGDMNVKVYKKMAQTFSAFDSTGAEQVWDVEVILRMSLIGGANLSGDVFAYWGGGIEAIGTHKIDVNVNRAGNPIDLYIEPDQTRWHSERSASKPNMGVFDFESAYSLVSRTTNLGNNYAAKRQPYTPWKTRIGGGIGTGESYYGYDSNYWGSVLDTRYRVGLRFRGYATVGYCSARIVSATYAATIAARFYAGSAQALLAGAAPLQAE